MFDGSEPSQSTYVVNHTDTQVGQRNFAGALPAARSCQNTAKIHVKVGNHLVIKLDSALN